MTLHNKPEHNTPEIVEALERHKLTVDKPSVVSDAFRLGWAARVDLAPVVKPLTKEMLMKAMSGGSVDKRVEAAIFDFEEKNGRVDHVREFYAEAILSALSLAPVTPFQQRVDPWMQECFGPEVSADVTERNHRFLEEALELVQSKGCTAGEAHQLVDYVFNRDVGEPHQEVGGVMVTLAALCLAADLDMDKAAEDELARIWTKTEKIRAKQAAKPKHSPLPQHVAPVVKPQQGAMDDLQALIDVVENETGALRGLCADEPDDEPVATYGDGRPAPMTFGHVRRAQAALKVLKDSE